MSFHLATPRVVLKALGCLAVASELLIVGCGPPGVGSSPSSKDQMKEFYAKGGQSQVVRRGRGTIGKNVGGPSNIKQRVFAAEADKSLTDK
jgi:hypothetical protein